MFQKKSGYDGMHASSILKNISSFWLRRYRIIFFTMFISICVWSGFLWYYSLYYFHWSDDQKQTYMNAQSHKSALHIKDFEKVIHVLDNRDSVYASEFPSPHNIFKTDPKVK